MSDEGIARGAPFRGSSEPRRLVVTHRISPFQSAIMGRHTAPVLHHPGTSTSVVPVPNSSYSMRPRASSIMSILVFH
jgi:hypothetical protein